MDLKGIVYVYVFMITLIYFGLRFGSLPETFEFTFNELFAYFFTLITVSMMGVALILWSAQRKAR